MRAINRRFIFALDFALVFIMCFAVTAFFVIRPTNKSPWYSSAAEVILLAFFATVICFVADNAWRRLVSIRNGPRVSFAGLKVDSPDRLRELLHALQKPLSAQDEKNALALLVRTAKRFWSAEVSEYSKNLNIPNKRIEVVIDLLSSEKLTAEEESGLRKLIKNERGIIRDLLLFLHKSGAVDIEDFLLRELKLTSPPELWRTGILVLRICKPAVLRNPSLVKPIAQRFRHCQLLLKLCPINFPDINDSERQELQSAVRASIKLPRGEHFALLLDVMTLCMEITPLFAREIVTEMVSLGCFRNVEILLAFLSPTRPEEMFLFKKIAESKNPRAVDWANAVLKEFWANEHP